MSWVLAALGFMALIVLHELGHFAAAKAVGMRVERFALFFPPLVWRRRGKGETEYAIGAIPLGGYVKISGMNPHEELPPEVAHRAYFRQPVWKRVVVILAGPVVNIIVALLILTGLTLANGKPADGARVDSVSRGAPAAGVLQAGDVITAVDGRTGDGAALSKRIATHRCAGEPRPGCPARTPVSLVVQRDGKTLRFRVRPVYDPQPRPSAMRLGFTRTDVMEQVGVLPAVGYAADRMWYVTTATVSTLAQLFKPEKRKDLSGVVGSYETARQAVELDATAALTILAIISLSLGIINLFPFLPLDGGHIFWALAEKVRRRPISFAVMERAGFVGFALVMLLFAVGLSNDITRLTGEGFNLR